MHLESQILKDLHEVTLMVRDQSCVSARSRFLAKYFKSDPSHVLLFHSENSIR